MSNHIINHLKIRKDAEWYEFEHNGQARTIPSVAYVPSEWGHVNGEYTYFGAGGVQATGKVKKEEGWCWRWEESEELHPWNGMFDSMQEAFDDAFNNLYVELSYRDKESAYKGWQDYAREHNLRIPE